GDAGGRRAGRGWCSSRGSYRGSLGFLVLLCGQPILQGLHLLLQIGHSLLEAGLLRFGDTGSFTVTADTITGARQPDKTGGDHDPPCHRTPLIPRSVVNRRVVVRSVTVVGLHTCLSK